MWRSKWAVGGDVGGDVVWWSDGGEVDSGVMDGVGWVGSGVA